MTKFAVVEYFNRVAFTILIFSSAVYLFTKHILSLSFLRSFEFSVIFWNQIRTDFIPLHLYIWLNHFSKFEFRPFNMFKCFCDEKRLDRF